MERDVLVAYGASQLVRERFSGMLASAIKGGFFGLFIAAFTKRDPDVFSEGTNQ